MILENLANSQKLISIAKGIKKQKKEVWDIGIFGSAVRGKKSPNDIDFVIFLTENISVKERLSISQKLREETRELVKNVNIETASLEDFLDLNFMARQGIVAESYLLLQKKYLSEALGFKTCAIFKFSLARLSNTQKTVFRYAINGRRGQKGILAEVQGEKLGAGAIKVPVQNSEKFKTFLESHKIEYKTETAMFYNFG